MVRSEVLTKPNQWQDDPRSRSRPGNVDFVYSEIGERYVLPSRLPCSRSSAPNIVYCRDASHNTLDYASFLAIVDTFLQHCEDPFSLRSACSTSLSSSLASGEDAFSRSMSATELNYGACAIDTHVHLFPRQHSFVLYRHAAKCVVVRRLIAVDVRV